MALAGYLTFGDKTQGNVLNNFPTNNVLVNVARLCFGLNMLSTLPLEAFVCREVMENYYFPGEPWDASRHLIFTTTLVTSAMGLSLMTCDLGVVFELVGVSFFFFSHGLAHDISFDTLDIFSPPLLMNLHGRQHPLAHSLISFHLYASSSSQPRGPAARNASALWPVWPLAVPSWASAWFRPSRR